MARQAGAELFCCTRTWFAVTVYSMRTTRKLGVCVLAAIVFALPTMACLMPSAAMSAAEYACCKHMAQDCGAPSMSKAHPCCQRVLDSDRFGVAQATAKNFGDTPTFVVLFHIGDSHDVLTPANVSAIRMPFDIQGSAESPPSAPFVLRI